MFTREDYIDYFGQLRDVETKMADKYRFLADTVQDEKLRAVFEQLYSEEMQHDHLVELLAEPFVHLLTD